MAGYVGDVAIAYDRDLGHVLFEHYAADVARRAANPANVTPFRDRMEKIVDSLIYNFQDRFKPPLVIN